MSVRKLSCRNVSFHGSDYDCYNGRFVTEGDYVDDGNDECFTLMVTIITIVVSVLHLSVMDYHHPEAVFSAAPSSLCVAELQRNFHHVFI